MFEDAFVYGEWSS